MSKKIVIFTALLLILSIPLVAYADRGMVVMGPQIELNQSAQNAIIAWNGKEEILILSTDVRAAANSPVLEIFPLPSNPEEIKEGSFFSFVKLTQIVNETSQRMIEKGDGAATPGVEVTFHKKVGAHDVTVVQVNELAEFLNWIDEFALEQGFEYSPLSFEFIDTVENYLFRGIKYFVFDLIEAGTQRTSINPLIYRFKTTLLYYPLAISATSDIGSSMAQVNLFIITHGYIIDQKPFDWANLQIEAGDRLPIVLEQKDLKSVNPAIAGLFQKKAYLTYATYDGYLDRLDFDLLMTTDDIMEVEESIEVEEETEETDGIEEIILPDKTSRESTKFNLKTFFRSWLWWEWLVLGLAVILIILEISLILIRKKEL